MSELTTPTVDVERELGAKSVKTSYFHVSNLPKYTFDNSTVRKWAVSHLSGEVLNACCGQNEIDTQANVFRNDIDESVNADTHVDAAFLAAEYGPNTFDCILYDPPWSEYQANYRYDGKHVIGDDYKRSLDDLPFEIDRGKTTVGRARLAKEGFDYLLKPGGIVIELSYNATCMPSRLQYERVKRVMFDPIGESNCMIGSVDRKVQTKFEGALVD